MTESEALKDIVENGINLGAGDYVNLESLKAAAKALEKQIPKKPIIETNRYTTLFICPSCGRKQGIRYKQYHCIDCGQRLDWGTESI